MRVMNRWQIAITYLLVPVQVDTKHLRVVDLSRRRYLETLLTMQDSGSLRAQQRRSEFIREYDANKPVVKKMFSTSEKYKQSLSRLDGIRKIGTAWSLRKRSITRDTKSKETQTQDTSAGPQMQQRDTRTV